jgi:type I restriction enzyme S subunit
MYRRQKNSVFRPISQERMMEPQAYRTYHKNECAVFLKTAEQFGGLSNMAGGYPLSINGIRILTSEALYQACRFPHLPEVQKLIIGQKSPMAAKMKSKPYRKDSRPDWDAVRVQVMRWCLRVKLVQHWEKFGDLLLSTGEKPIVEESYRDQFWGAKPTDNETLCGANVLGRLLVELREKLQASEAQRVWVVEPPPLSDFLLLGRPIGSIETVKGKHGLTSVSGKVQQELSDLEPSLSNGNINNIIEVNAFAEADQANSPVSPIEVSLSNSLQLYLFGPQ